MTLVSFIESQSCATICCVDAHAMPFCYNCYYSFHLQNMMLFYKTKSDTRHKQILNENRMVAGSILPDRLNKLTISGIQFEGEVLLESDADNESASQWYYQKNPWALAVPGELHRIRLNRIKFTNGLAAFTKKTIWEREVITTTN